MRIPAPLILGAGPAGCAAAIALARAGQRPVLVDRDEQVGDALCGGFISWRTAEQLAGLGIDCGALGVTRVTKLRIYAGQRCLSLPLPAPAWGLSRHALDSAMRAAAVAEGAELEIDNIRSLDGLIAKGTRRDWTGDALFLASGKHDLRGFARPRDASDPALGLRLRLLPGADIARQLEGTIELHLFDGGYAGIVLQEGGSANICLAVKKSLLTASSADPRRLLTDLAQRHPAFGARLEGSWRENPIDTIGAVPYGWIARDTPSGLFRLGDQAAVIPSLAGEGMAIALASAQLAARRWLAGGAPAAPGFQRQFARDAAAPLRMAGIARNIAESPTLARPLLAVLGRIPRIAAILLDRTRIEITPSLAPDCVAANTRANPT